MGICCQGKQIISVNNMSDVPVFLVENQQNHIQNDNTNNNSVNNDNINTVNKYFNNNSHNSNNKNNQTLKEIIHCLVNQKKKKKALNTNKRRK